MREAGIKQQHNTSFSIKTKLKDLKHYKHTYDYVRLGSE